MENDKPIVIDCKYFLPCGRCDKTNGMCSQLDGITFPVKPNKYSVNSGFCIPIDNGGVTPV